MSLENPPRAEQQRTPEEVIDETFGIETLDKAEEVARAMMRRMKMDLVKIAQGNGDSETRKKLATEYIAKVEIAVRRMSK